MSSFLAAQPPAGCPCTPPLERLLQTPHALTWGGAGAPQVRPEHRASGASQLAAGTASKQPPLDEAFMYVVHSVAHDDSAQILKALGQKNEMAVHQARLI